MKMIFALVALTLTTSAFAADDERIMQRRGEVKEIYSMSDLMKFRDVQAVKDIYIAQCKRLRNGDEQCNETGTEPVAILAHYSAGIGNKSLIPQGLELKKNAMVLTEGKYGEVMEVREIIADASCRWAMPLKLLGGQRIECADDKAHGWEETISILERYPLKHQQVATAE